MRIFKIMLLVPVFLAAMCTQIVADEYTEGLKKAKKEDKPVIIYFYSRY